MQSKEKSSKRDVPKISVPAEVVADAVGCSKSYVKAVRRGARDTNTETSKRIEIAEVLFEEGTSALIEAVKKAVKFK